MRNFNNHLEEFERFSEEYLPEEKEVLVLTDNSSAGGGKFYNAWEISQYFLAYVDVESGELKKGDGRLQWLVSEEENKVNSLGYPYNFEKMSIYHLKVRELIDKSVPEGCIRAMGNCLMVVEVLGKTEEPRLEEIKEAYLAPVTLSHDKLGDFDLDRRFSWFKGEITWREKEIKALLEVDTENQKTWHKALENLAFIVENQDKFDKEWREFSAKELTELANDWAEEGTPSISEEEFAKRLEISSITIYSNGNYTIYYNDDDLFYGHSIEIDGNIEKGIEYANMVG